MLDVPACSQIIRVDVVGLLAFNEPTLEPLRRSPPRDHVAGLVFVRHGPSNRQCTLRLGQVGSVGLDDSAHVGPPGVASLTATAASASRVLRSISANSRFLRSPDSLRARASRCSNVSATLVGAMSSGAESGSSHRRSARKVAETFEQRASPVYGWRLSIPSSKRAAIACSRAISPPSTVSAIACQRHAALPFAFPFG